LELGLTLGGLGLALLGHLGLFWSDKKIFETQERLKHAKIYHERMNGILTRSGSTSDMQLLRDDIDGGILDDIVGKHLVKCYLHRKVDDEHARYVDYLNRAIPHGAPLNELAVVVDESRIHVRELEGSLVNADAYGYLFTWVTALLGAFVALIGTIFLTKELWS